MAQDSDARLMAIALTLGRRGLGRTWPNPAVGALIVRDGSIAGRGWTQPGGRPHAEIEALRRAGQAARGGILYVTLEPCAHFGKSPPCADAVIAAGIARVVSALEDPNPDVSGAGHARLRAAGIAVEVGLGAEEARRDHAGHLRRMRDGRPHVLLKLAVSADGKVGGAGRRPLAITGEAVRERVHLMRAQSDAVMVGIGTVLSDDPMLTCRLPGMAAYSPLRIVLDSALRIPLRSRLAETANETPVLVMAANEASQSAETALRQNGVDVVRSTGASGNLDLVAALKRTAARGVTRLMVEGGPTLAASLLAADLVDELHVFTSSKIVGAEGIDAFNGPAAAALGSRTKLKQVKSEPVGADQHQAFERK